MGCLSREAILQAKDLPQEKVEVPEWGGYVWVRTLTAAERDAFEDEMLERRGKKREVNLRNVRARLCSLALVDDDGKQLFTEGDVLALGAKSARPMDRVYDAAAKLSGISNDDVEELAKNSASVPAGSSCSG